MRVEGKPELTKHAEDQRYVELGATKHVGQTNRNLLAIQIRMRINTYMTRDSTHSRSQSPRPPGSAVGTSSDILYQTIFCLKMIGRLYDFLLFLSLSSILQLQ